jgi:hypothetical protein
MSPPRCVYFLFPTLDYRKEPINPKVDGSRNIADLAGKHADLESFFSAPPDDSLLSVPKFDPRIPVAKPIRPPIHDAS